MKQNELFLKRTDALAEKLRLTLREACTYVDLSTGSFFGYRTGRVAVTLKAWKKLEAAENKAGIKHGDQPAGTELAQSEFFVQPKNQFQVELITQLAALTTAITEQNKRIDALIEQRVISSSPGRGQAVKSKRKKLA